MTGAAPISDETTELRIKRLEAEVAELKAMNAPMRAPPIRDEGVRVTFPRLYPIEMPNAVQYEALLAIVARIHPAIVSSFNSERDRREFHTSFVSAFERIACLRRLDGLNTKRTARDWADEAYHWLHERGTPAETMNGSFLLAVIAAGDVPFSLPQPAKGVPSYTGLTYDLNGRMASAAGWRRVLESGKGRIFNPPPQR